MFGSIIGNASVKETLRRLLLSNRVPNAMLFAGIDGVGKRLFALETAKAFLCRDKIDGEGCGTCPECLRTGHFEFPKEDDKDAHKKVVFSNHTDVGSVIPYKRNISVDAIRDLEREANFRPYESSVRFFLIDDADKMNDAAANALLKTLEEPPAASHIILITPRPDRLLPTIRSRCQVVRFAPAATGEIEQYLVNKRDFAPADATLAARLSNGSVGRAVAIDVRHYTDQRERMLAVLSHALSARDIAALLRIAEELNDAQNKDAFEDNLCILESLIHDMWSIASGREHSQLVNADVAKRLSDLAKTARSAELASWLASIQALRQNFVVNINRKVATDSLFAGMATRRSAL